MPVRIGLTLYGVNEDNQYHIPFNYIAAVRRAGGHTVCFPPGEDNVEPWLESIDGIVLTGGGDVEPKHYGGNLHDAIYKTDAARDSTEIQLVEKILERQIPMLAICRGLQLLNVVLGGTLIAHIPDTHGEQVLHRKAKFEHVRHNVKIEHGSRLAQIIPADQPVEIASLHHQAILDCADVVRPVAFADDGIIEAVEVDTHPNIIAVQWHPELTAAEDPYQQALFDYFIDITKKPLKPA